MTILLLNGDLANKILQLQFEQLFCDDKDPDARLHKCKRDALNTKVSLYHNWNREFHIYCKFNVIYNMNHAKQDEN